MVENRMTRARRWWAVAAATALLVAVPVVLRSLPASDSDVGAGGLLERVRSSQGRSWSGFVETEGALQLPDADEFSDLGRLFGERNRMRAWWQDDDHWRVDQLVPAGEKGLRHGENSIAAWDYERGRATFSRDPAIRLPRTADLLPPALAERLLRGVSDDDVERLSAERVAGRSAPGIRVVPASPLSSIDHADLWADGDSGVPLRVDVYAAGDDAPAFTSTFLDIDLDRPDDATVEFDPAERVDVDYDDVLDIADAANQYAPVRPPVTVLGLAQAEVSDRAVGVYGRGMTQFVAIPMRDNEADPLREQLRSTPGATQAPDRTVVSVGPLSVVVTGGQGDRAWLLAGTLTREAMARAATEVEAGFVYVEDDD